MTPRPRNDPNSPAHSTGSPPRPIHTVGIGLTLLAAVASLLAMVLLSPLLMREIGAGRGVDWARLSDVGQTYGAASAILSALALGGIAVSLLVQARQAKAQQIQTVRSYHLELLRLTLDNPQLYLPCWGIQIDPSGLDGNRQIVFTNLLMIYQQMGYEIGVTPESSMRGVILADSKAKSDDAIGRNLATPVGTGE